MAFSVDHAFAYLQQSHAQGRLAHAYLITGPEGAGKDELARKLIALINDLHAGQVETMRDPHVHLIRPESRSRRIKIGQIRALERQLHLSSAPGKTKIGVVRDADRLQRESENAFLKTLEEPPANTLLLLLTAQPEQLLETIRSRCLRVALYAPGKHEHSYPETFHALLEAMGRTLSDSRRSLSGALGLARSFSHILKLEKDQIARGNEAALKEEIARYGETTEGDWLRRREPFFKDRTESEYVHRRATMLEGILSFLGDALRLQVGYRRLDLPDHADLTESIAQQMPFNELNKRFASLEDLRLHLNTTVHDALAIEVAFVRAFA